MAEIIGIGLVVAMIWLLVYGLDAEAGPDKLRHFESMGLADNSEPLTHVEARTGPKRAA